MDSFLAHHGIQAFLLFCLLLLLEEAGLPLYFLPIDILLVASGALLAGGHLLWPQYLLGANLALLAGGLLAYAWTSKLGPPALVRLSRALHLEAVLAATQIRIQDASIRTAFLARLIPGLRFWVNLASGAARVPLRRFFPALLAATLVWTSLLGAAGFIFGLPFLRLLRHISFYADHILVAGFLALLLLLLLIFLPLRPAPAPLTSSPRSKKLLAITCFVDCSFLGLSIFLLVYILPHLLQLFTLPVLVAYGAGLILTCFYALVSRMVFSRSPGETLFFTSLHWPPINPRPSLPGKVTST